ncbi:type II secretion system secretin GspD [Geothrix sp. 21YS21S-4]|uniref:type II secretion system secretin GspD n=1 Tax=Geothrix sp. 21YS21S-4 TaxID=3068889 RepID=UPI0027B92CE4|nr:type II secretion system secretin GspD [Geothrix sp. 21YS21S-4]
MKPLIAFAGLVVFPSFAQVVPPQPVPQPGQAPAPNSGAPPVAGPKKPVAGQLIVRDKAGKDVLLNFANAKLYDVIQQVARVAGLNYTVDPAVKDGPVRLFMNGRLEEDGLLDVLSLALKLHGVAMVRNRDFLEFVPLNAATGRSASPLFVGTQPLEGMGESFLVTQVLPLKFLDAEGFGGFAKDFLSHDGKALPDKNRNLLILMDYVQNIRRVMDFADLMDKQPFEQRKLAFFRLKNASPDRVQKELEPLLKAAGVPVGTGALQLLPVSSLNGLLLISQATEWMGEVKSWIERFDEVPQTEDGEIFVLPVRYAKAETLYPLLTQVLRLPVGGMSISKNSNLTNAALPAPRSFGSPTNSLGGTLGAYPPSQTQGTAVQAPQPASTSTAVTPSLSQPGPLSPGVTISVDPDNNALVIFGPRRDYALIQAAVEKLDQVPRQVLIEATILDLSMTGEFELGLSGFIQSRFAPADVNVNSLPTPANKYDWRVDRTSSSGPFTFSGVAVSGSQLLGVLLSVKDSKSNVNVVSQPRIWALDNRPARLLVQDQIPVPVNTFIPGSGTGTGSSGYSVTNAQYLDTGLNLTVTPHINGSGTIRLEINQEISSSSGFETLGSGDSAIQAPRISRRSLSTELIAQDGATVILGGLVRQDSTHTTTGVPFFNRIPLLRNLLGSTRKVNTKSELVIMMTPRVISQAEDIDRVTHEIRERVDHAIRRMNGMFETLLPPSPSDPRHPVEAGETI